MKTCRNKSKIGLIYSTQKSPNNPALTSSSTLKPKLKLSQGGVRERAGSIRGLTPKRYSSVGKIVTRACTPRRMLSIQVQTSQMIPEMEGKGIVEEIVMIKMGGDKENSRESNRGKQEGRNEKQCKNMENTMKNNRNKVGFLKMADFNVLSQQADTLSRTIRKKCEGLYRKQAQQSLQNKQNINKDDAHLPFPISISTSTKYTQNTQKSQPQTKTTQPLTPMLQNMPANSKEVHRGNRQEKISKLSALYEKNLARYETSKTVLVNLLKQNKNK